MVQAKVDNIFKPRRNKNWYFAKLYKKAKREYDQLSAKPNALIVISTGGDGILEAP